MRDGSDELSIGYEPSHPAFGGTRAINLRRLAYASNYDQTSYFNISNVLCFLRYESPRRYAFKIFSGRV